MRPPVISVVVATHNRAERVRALLQSLRRQTGLADRFEVIVVDDGSQDRTPAVLQAEGDLGGLDLTILRHDRPLGPAAARNQGWRRSSGSLVAFTDDDCTVSEGWLAAGLVAWDGVENRIVQGPTSPDPAELHREGAFSRTLRVEALGPNFQTCNVFYPRGLLQRVGGFDAQTFTVPGGEDADLAWRCLAGGADAVFAPAARVWHAVHQLGPIGKLRVAWRWTETMRLFARHPGQRATLTYGIFWKKSHYIILRAAIAAVIPRRFKILRNWLAWPLYTSYVERARSEGNSVLAAPYFVVHDIVELIAVVRGAIRYRTLVL